MVARYIRKSGSDANDGLTPSTAWLTINKALNTGALAAGDVTYIGSGTYRESATLAYSGTAASPISLIADVDGSHTGDPGAVRWTNLSVSDTNGTTTNYSTLIANNRSYLTVQGIAFDATQGGGAGIDGSTNTQGITFRQCLFVADDGSGPNLINISTPTSGGAANHLFDSCIMQGTGWNNTFAFVTLPTSTVADYNANILFQNCLMIGGRGAMVSVRSSGTNAFKGGGVRLLNCTIAHNDSAFRMDDANVATSAGNQCSMYNCWIMGCNEGVNAKAVGQIVEDYNVFCALTPRTNVTAGTHSTSGSYFLGSALGYEGLIGRNPRPAFMPSEGATVLTAGAKTPAAGVSAPTTDLLGAARPQGTFVACGCYERGDTGIRETTTIHSGTQSLRLTGPGYQSFVIDVDTTSTTIAAWCNYDTTYAAALGLRPRLELVANPEIGVVAQSVTATVAAASAWEKQTLAAFTATKAGQVTVRIWNQCLVTTGSCYFDDWSVT